MPNNSPLSTLNSPLKREQQNLEWKESWRDDYLRWICGFANAEGGVLVIGRNDRGKPVGVANASRLLEEIPNKVRDVLGIMVAVNLVSEDGKELVEIRVDPYPSPVSYKGEYHYRSGSTKQELKGAALSHFLLKKQGLHWDAMALPGLKADALDAGALHLFRQQALRSQRLPEAALHESDALLLERLHLLADGVCKRATALLFHSQPSRWFTGAYVKIGFFESDADLRYQDEVDGPLLLQVNKTIEVLQAKYLKALISYEGLQRVETWPMPMAALREAVLNAVVHKDYTSGAPIQISVYSDKVMIWNSGSLPPEWTVERLLSKHPSAPFNPDIANTFFRSGQIESMPEQPVPNARRRTASSTCSPTGAARLPRLPLPRRVEPAREQPPHRDGAAARQPRSAWLFGRAHLRRPAQAGDRLPMRPASRSTRPICAPTSCCAMACRCRSPRGRRMRRCT
jgi:ATP-dependent DNA helicase RecG